MDSEQLQHLTPEQQDRYSKLEALFRTDGWQLIEQWAEQEVLNETARGANAASWDANRLSVGARLVYERIRNLATSTENEFASIAAAAEEEAALISELEYE